MALCFVDPADAVRAISDSIGREARRQLLGEAVRAWVDEIPDDELETHYAKALSELDEHDLSMLAAWHGSLEVGHPVPNRDFLMGAFGSLGENRREALKLAAGFRGEEAVRRRRRRGGRPRAGPRTPLTAPPDGPRVGGRRALHLGPRRLGQLSRLRFKYQLGFYGWFGRLAWRGELSGTGEARIFPAGLSLERFWIVKQPTGGSGKFPSWLLDQRKPSLPIKPSAGRFGLPEKRRG